MKIEHIALYVNDLEQARDFFVNYLGGNSNEGYHNKTTGFRSFFISFDDGARLEIMKKPLMWFVKPVGLGLFAGTRRYMTPEMLSTRWQMF